MLASPASGQESQPGATEVLRNPGWAYGFQAFGGTATMSTPSIPQGPPKYPSSFGAEFHLARILTHEHGENWKRGTLECDFNVIPVDIYLVNGKRYPMGGFEAIAPRWNFTRLSKHLVPYFGAAGGMLFGSQNFPPGDTSGANFTLAVDLGAHLFTRRGQSFEVTTRLHHLSNAGIGKYNPGVPLSLQLMLGYTWY
jgi:hypothetical protein